MVAAQGGESPSSQHAGAQNGSEGDLLQRTTSVSSFAAGGLPRKYHYLGEDDFARDQREWPNAESVAVMRDDMTIGDLLKVLAKPADGGELLTYIPIVEAETDQVLGGLARRNILQYMDLCIDNFEKPRTRCDLYSK